MDEERIKRLIEQLPPVAARVVRDVAADQVTAETIEAARNALPTEWAKYDIVRVVANGNPRLLASVRAEAVPFLQEMLADFERGANERDDNEPPAAHPN